MALAAAFLTSSSSTSSASWDAPLAPHRYPIFACPLGAAAILGSVRKHRTTSAKGRWAARVPAGKHLRETCQVLEGARWSALSSAVSSEASSHNREP
eukprot:CAMPEP_0172080198 /NCGR_PEP_ID=MMETSP1043-20130122/18598_1 /TAXON_ID=464988 /ORGANISM="Hemiselmis andersenii, Strain CCMP441" /LENGTH=96 /DNA_ID=CAMNT_0012741471 /DNA_START=39 /DNA_END=329 /DNA_ORIENTATION=-